MYPEGVTRDMLPKFTATYEVPALHDIMTYMWQPVDAHDEQDLEREWAALLARAESRRDNGELWPLCEWAVENLPVSRTSIRDESCDRRRNV